MITLVHTGVQVPHTRIRVTDLHQLETPTGVAWTAPLCEQDRRLGTITGHPNGGATHFQPSDRQARDVVEGFIAQCRSRENQPLDEDAVLTALTDEYDYGAVVARADADHIHLVRSFDQYGIPELFELQTMPGVPFDYRLARASAPHLDLGPRIVRAELWMGDRWEEFYRSP
ncbi:hypothetical protein [Streptomonospora salina]|uniref:Uncharacterized protein n=1 Tax=Streptomonospora salina TaxID=104205 RepID=A0A841E5J4_9ACTN|nr:hypothetical protein [Streptomonospora salina]MBB5998062.1 hypothetical protein [Streptomonospora salina]